MTFSPSALYACVDAGDWDSVCAMFAPDGCYERPGYPTFAGRSAIYVFYSKTRTLRGRHVIDGAAVLHDVACAWGCFEGVAHDGTPVSERFCDAFCLEHGLIRHRRTYFSRPAI